MPYVYVLAQSWIIPNDTLIHVHQGIGFVDRWCFRVLSYQCFTSFSLNLCQLWQLHSYSSAPPKQMCSVSEGGKRDANRYFSWMLCLSKLRKGENSSRAPFCFCVPLKTNNFQSKWGTLGFHVSAGPDSLQLQHKTSHYRDSNRSHRELLNLLSAHS